MGIIKVNQQAFVKGELSYPEFPVKVRQLKGCVFNPEVTLNSRTLYFVVVTSRHHYQPVRGFYDVPQKGFITWIDSFILRAASSVLAVGPTNHVGYVFEAREGTPPLGLTPFKPGNGSVPPGVLF